MPCLSMDPVAVWGDYFIRNAVLFDKTSDDVQRLAGLVADAVADLGFGVQYFRHDTQGEKRVCFGLQQWGSELTLWMILQ